MPPITPDEVEAQTPDIPEEVFEAFNELIAENMRMHGSSRVLQDKVIYRLIEKGINTSEAFDKHWFDVEPYYRKAGWKVEYDKPAYNESYMAYFMFTKPEAH